MGLKAECSKPGGKCGGEMGVGGEDERSWRGGNGDECDTLYACFKLSHTKAFSQLSKNTNAEGFGISP